MTLASYPSPALKKREAGPSPPRRSQKKTQRAVKKRVKRVTAPPPDNSPVRTEARPKARPKGLQTEKSQARVPEDSSGKTAIDSGPSSTPLPPLTSKPAPVEGRGRGSPGQPSGETREAFPVYRKNIPPKYPRLARRRGYQGTVLLDVMVDRTGKVSDLRIVRSSGYTILDRAAMESVKKWVFEPGMKEGRQVDMWVRVPIRFQLK